ncbi:MAG TPA: DUF2075 domain-containing protein [Tahibacter sp.]|uniref:DUF2075 domain-containing protein n=1 Tax=Tahibacter sp. TaxID=2056211 RepID=UPI002CD08145|nr:DUF2075 domain-containing protein [Tahibacter sp.]HSX60363.1 DUF2075 domain-containing protein [Tahibacter sp.]
MIVYQSTKRGFLADSDDRSVEEVVADAFLLKTGRYAPDGEFRAWRESLKHMAKVLRDDGIPGDTGVGIEFGIPQSQKRVDFMLSGFADDGSPRMIIIELKQWSSTRVCDLDGLIDAQRGGATFVRGPHPCYQAWSYAALLEGFNEAIYDGDVRLRPCAYLHNHAADGVVDDARYEPYIERAPLFLKGEAELRRLREFVKKHVKRGDDAQLLFNVESGRVRPSKMLADSVAKMLRGNQEFVLVDEQKVAYELALAAAEKASPARRQVVLVKGGPGTGKSVIAINLLATLTRRGRLTKYVSKNAAPRSVYQEKMTGHHSRGAIASLFGGSGAFHDTEPDTFDVLVVDEAHRLNSKSGLYGNLGSNQVMEIMRSAACAIFFVDDRQMVTLSDIGSSSEIRHWAEASGAEITELELDAQFRCGGSDSYLPWLDDVLGLASSGTAELDRSGFDFRVVDTPEELHELIEERNAGNRARVVAGYCWDWKSRRDPRAFDIEIGTYRKRWNLGSDGSLWIVAPRSVSEVGCIHTCQGLEVDYIGVILGPDLLFRSGRLVTAVENRSSMDRSVRGYRSALRREGPAVADVVDRLIRNTYRTLMTRGMKGCFVHCVDPETQQYFRDRLERRGSRGT